MGWYVLFDYSLVQEQGIQRQQSKQQDHTFPGLKGDFSLASVSMTEEFEEFSSYVRMRISSKAFLIPSGDRRRIKARVSDKSRMGWMCGHNAKSEKSPHGMRCSYEKHLHFVPAVLYDSMGAGAEAKGGYGHHHEGCAVERGKAVRVYSAKRKNEVWMVGSIWEYTSTSCRALRHSSSTTYDGLEDIMKDMMYVWHYNGKEVGVGMVGVTSAYVELWGFTEYLRDSDGGSIFRARILDVQESILLKVLRQNNMYSFDIKTPSLSKDYACLIAKATSDESKLWHRRVKIIRSDNGTEFKNRDMLEFYGNKGIKQEYSNARTPQQNGVAERMNRTLIEAARTMLADSLLPTTFWAEAVSTACYIFNRVRVTKPQNKTPYELLFGHKPIISYIRPFGCHVTILDTLSVLGKFDGKCDEGFLVGYSLNSKAFRVYNLVTKKVEVNLHVKFLEEKPNVKGVGYRWMFDIDYLTDSMNYIPVSLENQTNPHADSEEESNEAKGRKSQDDPLDLQYKDWVTPSSTRVMASGAGNQWRHISITLEAAKTLSKVASLKNRKLMLVSEQVKTAMADKLVLLKDVKKTPTEVKRKQVLQEEASLAEAIRLDTLQKEKVTKQHYTNEDWDLIRAKIEANAELSKSMLGSELQGEDFAKKMVDLVNQRKKYFAEERARAKRNKPTRLQSQLKDVYDELLEESRDMEVISAEEASDKDSKKNEEDVEAKDDEPTKKSGKRRKQMARKGLHTSVDKDDSE
ncbi:ribonuclease H-like domain-containing protein [Tanacetum coccineum]|uniref:Ribonuclease H-like domain-containing protein n=1 Tax=Tanacetum coccineum TaxID=301880 RepID=A0ABQ5B8S5_9ASTR